MKRILQLWWRCAALSAVPTSRAGIRRSLTTMTLAAGVSASLLARTAEGGGTIGWADAVGQFADEGAAVGAFAVILGIMAVGAIVMFGITGLITTVVMVCLGGALMGQAEAVGQTLFGAGTGGGSIHDVAAPTGGPG